MTPTSSSFYGVADVLKSCSNGTFTGKHKNELEMNYQQTGYVKKYDPEIDAPETLVYPHWIFTKYSTETQDIDQTLVLKQVGKTEILSVVHNRHPVLSSQIDEFWEKLKNRQIITIGDSLGRQVIDFMEQIVLHRGKCGNYLNIDFWGVKRDPTCPNNADSFNPKIKNCVDPKTQAKTIFAFFPHGKPLHHGGCSFQRMPWMTETFKRIEEYADLQGVFFLKSRILG